jgi:hypothetical protein
MAAAGRPRYASLGAARVRPAPTVTPLAGTRASRRRSSNAPATTHRRTLWVASWTPACGSSRRSRRAEVPEAVHGDRGRPRCRKRHARSRPQGRPYGPSPRSPRNGERARDPANRHFGPRIANDPALGSEIGAPPTGPVERPQKRAPPVAVPTVPGRGPSSDATRFQPPRGRTRPARRRTAAPAPASGSTGVGGRARCNAPLPCDRPVAAPPARSGRPRDPAGSCRRDRCAGPDFVTRGGTPRTPRASDIRREPLVPGRPTCPARPRRAQRNAARRPRAAPGRWRRGRRAAARSRPRRPPRSRPGAALPGLEVPFRIRPARSASGTVSRFGRSGGAGRGIRR